MVIPPTHQHSLETEIERTVQDLLSRDFADVGAALRARIDSTLKHWRQRIGHTLPSLDALTLIEFENAVAEMLESLAAALESRDLDFVRSMIRNAPQHGLHRFAQKIDPHTLLAESRVLRAVIILELREHMQRDLTAEEAASFHELYDIIGEYSILALIGKRSDARDAALQETITGMHRLADLGTLVAGVAHDAANLMLPLRSYLDNLLKADVPEAVHQELQAVVMIVQQFQNTITNLRWMSIDSRHRPNHAPHDAIDLHEWCGKVSDFYRRMLPRTIEFKCDIPETLPKALISNAALSQAVFNVVRNAQQALEKRDRGCIAIRAREHDDHVEVIVEDDGPGMPPAIRERAGEPFFGTTPGGSGLGLALVKALVTGVGGSVAIHSPPRALSLDGSNTINGSNTPASPMAHDGQCGTQIILNLKTGK